MYSRLSHEAIISSSNPSSLARANYKAFLESVFHRVRKFSKRSNVLSHEGPLCAFSGSIHLFCACWSSRFPFLLSLEIQQKVPPYLFTCPPHSLPIFITKYPHIVGGRLNPVQKSDLKRMVKKKKKT